MSALQNVTLIYLIEVKFLVRNMFLPLFSPPTEFGPLLDNSVDTLFTNSKKDAALSVERWCSIDFGKY